MRTSHIIQRRLGISYHAGLYCSAALAAGGDQSPVPATRAFACRSKELDVPDVRGKSRDLSVTAFDQGGVDERPVNVDVGQSAPVAILALHVKFERDGASEDQLAVGGGRFLAVPLDRFPGVLRLRSVHADIADVTEALNHDGITIDYPQHFNPDRVVRRRYRHALQRRGQGLAQCRATHQQDN